MYDAEDKRIKQLYGPKPQAEYTIKLNNELIDKELESDPRGKDQESPRSSNVVTGKTIKATEQQRAQKKYQENMKDEQNFVFATHKKLKLGPGQYDAKFTQTKKAIKNTLIDAQPKPKSEVEIIGEKIRQDTKKIRQFDGSAATIKKIPPLPQVKELSERLEHPVFGADGQ